MDIFARRQDPDSWVEISPLFKGQIVAEDREYVVLSNNGVEVLVEKSDVMHWNISVSCYKR